MFMALILLCYWVENQSDNIVLGFDGLNFLFEFDGELSASVQFSSGLVDQLDGVFGSREDFLGFELINDVSESWFGFRKDFHAFDAVGGGWEAGEAVVFGIDGGFVDVDEVVNQFHVLALRDIEDGLGDKVEN